MIDEQEIQQVERAKEDPEAFGVLYDNNYSRILNYAFRRVMDVEAAEDITSMTFLHALRALPKYKHNAPFRCWLYAIAGNEVRMYRRSQMRRGKFTARVVDEMRNRHSNSLKSQRERFSPPKRLEEFARLHDAISELPDDYQNVLCLRYFEDLPHSDISDILGKREGTVRSLVSLGVKKLRDILEKCEE